MSILDWLKRSTEATDIPESQVVFEPLEPRIVFDAAVEQIPDLVPQAVTEAVPQNHIQPVLEQATEHHVQEVTQEFHHNDFARSNSADFQNGLTGGAFTSEGRASFSLTDSLETRSDDRVSVVSHDQGVGQVSDYFAHNSEDSTSRASYEPSGDSVTSVRSNEHSEHRLEEELSLSSYNEDGNTGTQYSAISSQGQDEALSEDVPDDQRGLTENLIESSQPLRKAFPADIPHFEPNLPNVNQTAVLTESAKHGAAEAYSPGSQEHPENVYASTTHETLTDIIMGQSGLTEHSVVQGDRSDTDSAYFHPELSQSLQSERSSIQPEYQTIDRTNASAPEVGPSVSRIIEQGINTLVPDLDIDEKDLAAAILAAVVAGTSKPSDPKISNMAVRKIESTRNRSDDVIDSDD